MTDPVTPVTPDPAKETPVTPVTPAPGGEGTPAPTDNKPDSTKLAEDLGKAKKELEDMGVYKSQMDPILETLAANPELLKKVTFEHNKRLGKIPKDSKFDDNQPTTPVTPAAAPDSDTRNATINIINNKFEESKGINKLPEDKQKEVRGMIGQMIKNMVDPKDNKTIQQVFEEISLTKLNWYFERAWDLINKDSDVKKSFEEGQRKKEEEYAGLTGIMGSIPGGSLPASDIALSPLEKATAKKMGVSEENYLKNKKEMNQSLH